MSAIKLLEPDKSVAAVSSLKMTAETEKEASTYDIIVRFNIGSNAEVLSASEHYNGRTDICALSGWAHDIFGPLSGFCEKEVLMTRPRCEEGMEDYHKKICVKEQVEKEIAKHAKSVSYIPNQVLKEIKKKYDYGHPSSGCVAVYYMSHTLKMRVDCINFLVDDKMFNSFTGKNKSAHNVWLERRILWEAGARNLIL